MQDRGSGRDGLEPTRRSGEVSAGKPKVAVTRIIPEAGLRMVREATEMRLWEDELPPSPAQLLDLLHGCDGAITLLTDRVDCPLLDREPQLARRQQFRRRLRQRRRAGRDRAQRRRLQHARRLDRRHRRRRLGAADGRGAADRRRRRLCPRRQMEDLGTDRSCAGQDIAGATLGIVGFGRIGQELAKRARGFDMTILAYDAYHDEAAAVETRRHVRRPRRSAPSAPISSPSTCALTRRIPDHLIGVPRLESMKLDRRSDQRRARSGC